jgi:hypothetical protein
MPQQRQRLKPLVRLLFPLVRPLYRWILAHAEPDDPWAPSTSWVPLAALGPGSEHSFAWYLEGETTVHPTTIEEMCDWLGGCVYQSDSELFHERDFWQHPKTFEHLRKGDCEDFALWAWRKLLELGIEARFFIGQRCSNKSVPWHAWVVLKHQGQQLLFEPQAPRDQMLVKFEDARDKYIPYFFVDRACKPVAVEGYLYYLKRRDLQRKPQGHAT